MIKLEHSRRLNNPDNFNEDGTIKHGHLSWVKSNNYKKLIREFKTIHRKRSNYVKNEHENKANEIQAEEANNQQELKILNYAKENLDYKKIRYEFAILDDEKRIQQIRGQTNR